MLSLGGLAVYLANLVLIGAILCRPLYAPRPSADGGDGFSVVRLPPPAKRNHVRSTALIAVTAVAIVLFFGLRDPQVDLAYRHLVVRAASLVRSDPSGLARASAGVGFGVRWIAVAYIVGLALAIRAEPLRRLAVAFNSVWLLIAFVLVDAGAILIGSASGLPSGWIGVLRAGAAIMAIVVTDMRILLTTFDLPCPTRLPIVKSDRRRDSVLAVVVLTAVVATAATLAAVAFRPRPAPSVWLLVAGYSVFPILLSLGRIVLAAFNALFGSLPEPPATRRPIDVIVPAYNESPGIAEMLIAIDAAAVRYGGPVRVIVSNDGSTDETGELAEAVIATFRAATGTVVNSGHQGKAWALNYALAEARADIVVRVDADTIIHPEAFVFTPAWFEDSRVGSVSAMTLPRHQDTWYAHLRVFECLFEFGLCRRGDQVIDAIACVPGTFTAFRREPALAFGGFVMGMNGEDADLTLQLGRAGYRTVLDPRIRIFEDVPRTFGEFLEQRTRWSRGGAQLFARHAPFRAGSAGPRSWFSLFRVYSRRITTQLRVPLILLAFAAAIMVPSARHNLATVLVLNVLLVAPIFAVWVLLAAGHGQLHNLWYLPLYFPFQMVRRLAMFESTLSLPTRPVGRPRPVPGERDRPVGAALQPRGG